MQNIEEMYQWAKTALKERIKTREDYVAVGAVVLGSVGTVIPFIGFVVSVAVVAAGVWWLFARER